MNLEAARMQMIGQQIRAWDVFDARVLEVLRDTPRELFVPPGYSSLAFADTEIPLGHGQYMLAPKIEGRLLQAVDPSVADNVLQVGTGSGYLSACFAKLARHVVSLDIYSEFTNAAAAKINELGLTNVEISASDACQLPATKQFDIVAVTASVPELDDHFIRMLKPGGRLFIVVGRAPVMEARLITLQTNGGWTEESLFETVLVPLLNAEQPEPFVL